MIYTNIHSKEEFKKNLPIKFQQQLIKQIGKRIITDFGKYIPEKKLGFDFNLRWLTAEIKRGYVAANYCSISIPSINANLFDITACWKTKTGEILLIEEITDQELEFWLENYPTEEEIEKAVNGMKDLWEPEKKEKLINQKFRYKLRQSEYLGFNFPDLQMVIKIKEKALRVETIIQKTIRAYNDFSEKQNEALGLIHDFKLYNQVTSKLLFHVDLGSALLGGLLAILNGLEEAKDLKIDSISIS